MKQSFTSPATFKFRIAILGIPLLLSVLLSTVAAQIPPENQERGIGIAPSGEQKTSGPFKPVSPAERPELVLQTGHTQRVDHIVFGPKGAWLATGGADSKVDIWDPESGNELRSLYGHTSFISALARSDDGHWLASEALDKIINIWDVTNGKLERSIAGQPGRIAALAFSPDGALLVSGSGDNTVKVWDRVSGSELRSLSISQAPVSAMAFSPDGKWLAAGCGDNSISVWEVGSWRPLILRGHNGRVNALAFSPDSQWLASGGDDRAVKLWNPNQGVNARDLKAQNDAVLALQFDPTGKSLISESAGNTTTVWDVISGNAENSTTDPAAQRLIAAAFSPDGARVALSTGDRKAQVREAASGKPVSTLDSRTTASYSAAFSPDGHWFASGNNDNSVKVWEVTTGRELYALTEASAGFVQAVAFSPDSLRLASAGQDGAIRIWDPLTGRQVTRFGTSESINALAFSPDGKLLVSGGTDGAVRLWETGAWRELPAIQGNDEVLSIAFSPDGHSLASGSIDKTVKVWDVATAKLIAKLTGHAGAVYSVAFSTDGKLLASGSGDKTIRIWNAGSGELIRTLKGHSGWINSVAFNPDGTRLVSGSADRAVRVWNTTMWSSRELTGHTGEVSSVTFDRYGRLIVSVSQDGSTRVWDADSGSSLATLISSRDAGDWLVVAPEGRFDGSPASWGAILWRFSHDTFKTAPVEAFFNEYFYPGMLADIFAGRRLPPIPEVAVRDRRQPRIGIVAENYTGPISTRDLKLRLEVSEAPADTDYAKGSGAFDLRLFRNGTLVQVWRGDALKLAAQGGLHADVPVIAGPNQFMAYAFNRDNVKSTNAVLNITGAESLKRQGTAYVIAVGVNRYANPQFDLKYAVNDASSFNDELKLAESKLGLFEHVEVISLLNENATKGNILTVLKKLAGLPAAELPASLASMLERVRPIEPEDSVILYYAGHGLAVAPRFYLIPHDLGYTGPRSITSEADLRVLLSHSISDQELEAIMEHINADEIIVVLDACNSGQILKSDESRLGPMNAHGMAQLAYEKGMYILTAAESFQAAQESKDLKHGYLTYALIEEGLKAGYADREPRDGRVLVREWFDYATERVPEMQLEVQGGGKKASRGLGLSVTVQRPRMFYRRELESQPEIIARPEDLRSNK